jgi:hypothetical protein
MPYFELEAGARTGLTISLNGERDRQIARFAKWVKSGRGEFGRALDDEGNGGSGYSEAEMVGYEGADGADTELSA